MRGGNGSRTSTATCSRSSTVGAEWDRRANCRIRLAMPGPQRISSSCISAVGPSQPTELRSKYLEAGPCLRIDQRQIHEHADASYPLGRLLRTRSERPRGSARKSHDNTPAPHSITSAAQGARLGPLPVGVTHGQGRGARRGWRGRSMSGGDATRGVRSEVHARASDRGTSPPWRKRPA